MKKLFLVRGVSGAGKSTFVRAIAHMDDEVVANDDFMINDDGEYIFDETRLDEVAIKCQAVVAEAMNKGVERIFVHNTFTTKKEMEPYFDLAHEHGYEVFTLIVENRGGFESLHDVPEPTLKNQKERFDIQL